jgi:hypothetical protein
VSSNPARLVPPDRGWAGEVSMSSYVKFVLVGIVLGILFSLAVVGLRASTTALALGYTLCGGWSLLHRPRLVPTEVAPWFPPLCAAFAFVVALALLVGPWRPMA